MKNLKNQMDQALAEIETLSKKARFEQNVNFDKTAREIASLADRVKDLSYQMAVAS